jgi:hypothetical protein
MNTPYGVATPNTSDPSTPGDKGKPTALGSATTTALAGTSLAVLTVWIIDNWMTAGGKPIVLNVEQAVAIGSVGASVFGYLTQVAHALIYAVLKKLDAV